MLLVLVLGVLYGAVLADNSDTVLVLGGQGLAGSATLSALLDANFKVSALNDDTNYYDYHELYKGKIESLACSRGAGLDGCFELQNFFKSNTKVRAIIDFTSSKPRLMEEAVRLLGPLNPDVYIFVSAAAIYDVSDNPEEPLSESAGVRPEDPAQRETYNTHNEFGHNMLGSEEVLKASELPYVIFRCGDIVGPRDSTYRWWQYQVWSEHFNLIGAGFPVPKDYEHLPFSLTYGADVAKAAVSIINKGIMNKVYNIAMSKTFTLPHYLLELCTYFRTSDSCWADYTEAPDTYNLYPSNHMGILDIEQAKVDLDFEPTSWEEVLESTIEFYEGARNTFTKERDIVLSRLNKNVVPYLRVEPLNAAVLKKETTVEINEKPELNRVEL